MPFIMTKEEIIKEIERQEKALKNPKLIELGFDNSIMDKINILKGKLEELNILEDIRTKKIINIPSSNYNIEVGSFNLFPRLISWHNAKTKCERLGNGWRLPTTEELEVMYKHKEVLTDFVFPIYWSSELCNDYDAYVFGGFQNGVQIGKFHCDFNLDYGARAVRTIE